MIVLRRNDRRIVLTGWREQAFSIAALVVSWVLVAVFIMVLIGIGVSVGLVLLLLLPAALVALTIQAAFGRRSS
jgi:hypothetical protein